MSEPAHRTVDTGIFPDFSLLHLYADAEVDQDELMRVPTPTERGVGFGSSFLLIATDVFNPVVTMEWWEAEPPAVAGELRGEGVIDTPDRRVSVTNTTSGPGGHVFLGVPADQATVRVTAVDLGTDEYGGVREDFVIALWPTAASSHDNHQRRTAPGTAGR